jgi:hypothetical protein
MRSLRQTVVILRLECLDDSLEEWAEFSPAVDVVVVVGEKETARLAVEGASLVVVAMLTLLGLLRRDARERCFRWSRSARGAGQARATYESLAPDHRENSLEDR